MPVRIIQDCGLCDNNSGLVLCLHLVFYWVLLIVGIHLSFCGFSPWPAYLFEGVLLYLRCCCCWLCLLAVIDPAGEGLNFVFFDW